MVTDEAGHPVSGPDVAGRGVGGASRPPSPVLARLPRKEPNDVTGKQQQLAQVTRDQHEQDLLRGPRARPCPLEAGPRAVKFSKK